MTATSLSSDPASLGAVPARVYSIQYLRAIAALTVVTLHAGGRVEAHLPEAIAYFLPIGHAGVDLFFVISGFIMWTIGRDFSRGPGEFLLRRVIRVAPPYWIATLAWVGFMLAAGYKWISLAPGHLAQSLLFTPHWSPTFPGTVWPVLVPGWTLIFEMFFYAVFALALLAGAGMWRFCALLGLLGGLILAGALFDPEHAPLVIYSSPLLLEFMAGCLVADISRRWQGGPLRGASLMALGLVLLVWLGPGVTADQTSWNRPLIFGTAGFLIVWGGVCLERHLPHLPLLERLGDASYSIYLFHLFVVTLMMAAWVKLPAVQGTAGALIFVALCLVLASLVGLWLYARMERPLQRTLNSLLRSWKRRPGLAGR